jgi:hypothetical protein
MSKLFSNTLRDFKTPAVSGKFYSLPRMEEAGDRRDFTVAHFDSDPARIRNSQL